MHDAVRLLQASPIGPLLNDKYITDVTYNGEEIYYLSSLVGRQFHQLYSKNDALNLIRQIANLTNQLFTFQNPVLDVVFAHYRLSAVHPLIGRDKEDAAVSFALRIANLNKNLLVESGTITNELELVLRKVMAAKRSIVLSGQTGVGKTELQRYLIGLLEEHERLLVIDQGIELALTKTHHPHLDLTLWRYENRSGDSSLASLIKTSLRFNPDYIVVAEARGEEIIDIYNATLSGHPSIFTMHSQNEEVVFDRMLAMTNYELPVTRQDLTRAFPYIIHLSKRKEGDKIMRTIKCIVSYENNQDKGVYLYYEKV